MSVKRYPATALMPTKSLSRLQGAVGLAGAQLADSPLGAWQMQDTSGTTAVDSSGNGRDGTYSGATLAQSAIGTNGAYSVSMGSIAIADAAWLDVNSWTFEALVYATSWSSYRGIATRDDEGSDRAWAFRVNAGQSNLLAWSTVSLYQANGGTTLSTSTAYLLAARFDSTANTATTWVNGTLWATVASSGTAKAGANGMKIGVGSLGGSYAFSGKMSHAAYYGTALSDARLLAHAQAAGLA